MGGDEFCIILPDCDELAARTVARRIAEDFAALGPDYSVSFGVCETGRQDYVDEETLLHRADERMYDNKLQGRDYAA